MKPVLKENGDTVEMWLNGILITSFSCCYISVWEFAEDECDIQLTVQAPEDWDISVINGGTYCEFNSKDVDLIPTYDERIEKLRENHKIWQKKQRDKGREMI